MRKYKDIKEGRDKRKEKWAIEYRDYWIPLDGEIREDTEFFNDRVFQKEFGMEKTKAFNIRPWTYFYLRAK